MTKVSRRPRQCATCETEFIPRSNAAKICDLCRSHDKHRHGKRAAAIPTMFLSWDNEGRQDGEGDDAVMNGLTLSWGMENGESGTYVWNWDQEAPYEEYGAVGAIRYMSQLGGSHYEIKQPWGEHPIGTKVRLQSVSFHFNYDSAILLKGFDLEQMEVVRKVQRKIQSVVCRADHDDNADCPLLKDSEALTEAVQQEADRVRASMGKDDSAPEDEVDTIEGVIHAYDPDDINAVIIEGGESDLVAWDRRSGLAITSTPRRRFYVENRPCGDFYGGWHGRVDVHDTGSAFVGGLEKAISDWNPPISDAQRAAIKWGKAARHTHFQGATMDMIAAYSEAECVAHAMMCRQLQDTIKAVGNIPMAPRHLFGSGSVAKAALDHWHAPKRGLNAESKQKSILDHEEIAQLTYFGGLIHTPLVGHIPLTDTSGAELAVLGQDINSAYPDKFVDVPCMRRRFDKDTKDWVDCGEWKTTTRMPHAKYVVGHVLASWDISTPGPDGRPTSPTSTPPFVVRGQNMGVYHPMMGYRVWVSLAEFRAAKKRFGKKIEAHTFLYFREDCTCDNPRPLQRVSKLYDERLALKDEADTIAEECRKANSELTQEFWEKFSRQNTIKLIINSIYGKFGQMRPSPGAYTNLHIASYITGATRAQMRQKIWDIEARSGTIAYVHTDAGYALTRIPEGETLGDQRATLGMEDEGRELGKFGAEAPNRDMLLWQPGLTYAKEKYKKGEWHRGGKVAARGIGTSVWERAAEDFLTEAELGTVDFTQHPKDWPAMHATDKVMIGLRKARAMHKPHRAGTFQRVEKRLSVCGSDVVDGQVVVMPGQRRDFANAVQVDGIPTLWSVPPIVMVADPAELGDIKQYRTALAKRYKTGHYDQDDNGK